MSKKTYANLLHKLGSRTSRKVANHTYISKDSAGVIALRLHQTNILTVTPAGVATVTSGGWKTSTTKARLNDYLPGYSISQAKGVWHWSVKNPAYNPDDANCAEPYWLPGGVFTDGDQIGPRGALRGQAKGGAVQAIRAEVKKITAYAQKCAEALPLPVLPEQAAVDYFDLQSNQNATDLSRAFIGGIVDNGEPNAALIQAALKWRQAGPDLIAAAFNRQSWLTPLACTRTKTAVRDFLKLKLGLAR